MARPIDADALLAEYDAQHEGPPGRARALIENAPTVGGWISADDRLPERKQLTDSAFFNSSEYVIVYLDNVTWPFHRKLVTIGRYDYNSAAWVVRNAYKGIVTHWRPLPEPPKEDNNG